MKHDGLDWLENNKIFMGSMTLLSAIILWGSSYIGAHSGNSQLWAIGVVSGLFIHITVMGFGNFINLFKVEGKEAP